VGIKKFKSFHETIEEVNNDETNRKRSGRLLTDEQLKKVDTDNITTGPTPTILFTDVVGSSKLWSEDPITMSSQLDKHFIKINSISKQYNGFVVKTIGDAFMVYFKPGNSLQNAINCAKSVLKSEELPLRIGICSGSMEEKTYELQNAKLKDYFGNAVNIASRMESKVAEEGGIAFTSVNKISSETIDSLGAKKLEEIPFLKGVTVDSVYMIKVK
jgi:class 3 adenylate cyclase